MNKNALSAVAATMFVAALALLSSVSLVEDNRALQAQILDWIAKHPVKPPAPVKSASRVGEGEDPEPVMDNLLTTKRGLVAGAIAAFFISGLCIMLTIGSNNSNVMPQGQSQN